MSNLVFKPVLRFSKIPPSSFARHLWSKDFLKVCFFRKKFMFVKSWQDKKAAIQFLFYTKNALLPSNNFCKYEPIYFSNFLIPLRQKCLKCSLFEPLWGPPKKWILVEHNCDVLGAWNFLGFIHFTYNKYLKNYTRQARRNSFQLEFIFPNVTFREVIWDQKSQKM